MSNICFCKFPLLVIDERDEKPVEYLAIPIQVISEMGGSFVTPEIDENFHELPDSSGIIRQYVKVIWKEAEKDVDFVKKYDVVGHIVQAGCSREELQGGHSESDSKSSDSKSCDTKSIYEVYHPLDEWVEQHIVTLK